MAANVVVDSGFLVGLLRGRDNHHAWAAEQARRHPRPWHTCEAALSEAFVLLGVAGVPRLSGLLRRQAVLISFKLSRQSGPVLTLMEKYSGVSMSLADACLVRMTELMDDPLVLTTDSHFGIYRRHGRQVVPHSAPR